MHLFSFSGDGFPGPSLRLLGFAIMVLIILFFRLKRLWWFSGRDIYRFIFFQHHLSEDFTEKQLVAWVKLMCYKKILEWNNDKSILYLLGVITEIVFATNEGYFNLLIELLKNFYTSSIQVFRRFIYINLMVAFDQMIYLKINIILQITNPYNFKNQYFTL